MSKKTFISKEDKNNPAYTFITRQDTISDTKTNKPIRAKKAPQKTTISKTTSYSVDTEEKPTLKLLQEETKSRRLQLIIQPSLYSRIKKQATTSKLSVNETIHQLLNISLKEIEK